MRSEFLEIFYNCLSLEEEDVKNIKYHHLEETEMWRMTVINEVLQIKSGERELPDEWSLQELEDILELACTS